MNSDSKNPLSASKLLAGLGVGGLVAGVVGGCFPYTYGLILSQIGYKVHYAVAAATQIQPNWSLARIATVLFLLTSVVLAFLASFLLVVAAARHRRRHAPSPEGDEPPPAFPPREDMSAQHPAYCARHLGILRRIMIVGFVPLSVSGLFVAVLSGAAYVNSKVSQASIRPVQPPDGTNLVAAGEITGPSKLRRGESLPVNLILWLTNAPTRGRILPLDSSQGYLATARLQAPAFETTGNDTETAAQPVAVARPASWSWILAAKENFIGVQTIKAEVALQSNTNAQRALLAPSQSPHLTCQITVVDPIGLPAWAAYMLLPLFGFFSTVAAFSFVIRFFGRKDWPAASAQPSSESTTVSKEPCLASHQPITKRTFHVALSFPGEQRPFVSELADRLSAILGKDNIFFDKYYEAELAQPDLDLLMGNIYEHQSRLLVPFFCADYARKKWCNVEWRRMRQILFGLAAERIMPFRFDEAPIEGFLPGDGYIMVGSRTPQEVANLILERLQRLPSATQPHATEATAAQPPRP